jgi:hypothetical protein
MAIVELSFMLSAPARRALESLHSPASLEFVAERFFDKIEHERYREFVVKPQYYTSPHGYRLARSGSARTHAEKLQSQRTRMTIKTFRGMKKLEARGLGLTWQMEEILYFGFQSGYIDIS